MKGNARHAKIWVASAILLVAVFVIIYIVSGIRNTGSGNYKYESYEYFDTITEITV